MLLTKTKFSAAQPCNYGESWFDHVKFVWFCLNWLNFLHCTFTLHTIQSWRTFPIGEIAIRKLKTKLHVQFCIFNNQWAYCYVYHYLTTSCLFLCNDFRRKNSLGLGILMHPLSMHFPVHVTSSDTTEIWEFFSLRFTASTVYAIPIARGF